MTSKLQESMCDCSHSLLLALATVEGMNDPGDDCSVSLGPSLKTNNKQTNNSKLRPPSPLTGKRHVTSMRKKSCLKLLSFGYHLLHIITQPILTDTETLSSCFKTIIFIIQSCKTLHI